MTVNKLKMILDCQGIGISFDGRPVLNNVSLDVSEHEVLGLVGPNGAGKTSLFEILCGRYTASAGKVNLLGTDITGYNIHGRASAGLGAPIKARLCRQR